MYSSTKDYIDALRCGDYLRALEWLDFLIRHYESDKAFDAETILNLAIFELVNHGFISDDLKQIKILYDLIESGLPFAEKAAYCATIWRIAAAQCVVYAEEGVASFYYVNDVQNANAIKQLMDKVVINDAENNILLSKMMQEIAEITISSEEIQSICEQLMPILKYQRCITEYVDILECHINDKVQASYFGMVRSLQHFLMSQNQLSAAVLARVEEDIDLMRAQRAQTLFDWEEAYFDELSPKSLQNKIYDYSSNKLSYFINQLFFSSDYLSVNRLSESPSTTSKNITFLD